MREVESLNERIQEYDRRIEKMAKRAYPETTLLKQVKGVGDLIATTYVLTILAVFLYPHTEQTVHHFSPTCKLPPRSLTNPAAAFRLARFPTAPETNIR